MCPTFGVQFKLKTKFSDDLSLSKLVPEKGIEPPTFALRMRCSTD